MLQILDLANNTHTFTLNQFLVALLRTFDTIYSLGVTEDHCYKLSNISFALDICTSPHIHCSNNYNYLSIFFSFT